ncbi:MAG: hypothetical protein ACOYT4_03165 [Nanoarchaeota archaeon]
MIILESVGITNRAIDLAKTVYNLKSKDSNIKDITFARYSIKGFSGTKFLVAKVELKSPFPSLEQFKFYLSTHNLPSQRMNI